MLRIGSSYRVVERAPARFSSRVPRVNDDVSTHGDLLADHVSPSFVAVVAPDTGSPDNEYWRVGACEPEEVITIEAVASGTP